MESAPEHCPVCGAELVPDRRGRRVACCSARVAPPRRHRPWLTALAWWPAALDRLVVRSSTVTRDAAPGTGCAAAVVTVIVAVAVALALSLLSRGCSLF